MKRYTSESERPPVHQKGNLVRVYAVRRFLKDLEQDQNIHVVMSKIRFMKEHLK